MPGTASKRARRAPPPHRQISSRLTPLTNHQNGCNPSLPTWRKKVSAGMKNIAILCDLYAQPRSSTPLSSVAPEPPQSHHRSEIESRLSDEGREIKISNVKSPPTLDANLSPQDFITWRSVWQDFTTLARVGSLSLQEQAALLRSCLSRCATP